METLDKQKIEKRIYTRKLIYKFLNNLHKIFNSLHKIINDLFSNNLHLFMLIFK